MCVTTGTLAVFLRDMKALIFGGLLLLWCQVVLDASSGTDGPPAPIPPAVIRELRDLAPNLAGLKVSNQPFEDVEPYLVEGLDLFIGAESLVVRGLERGAAGAVSGLAAVP